MLCACLVLCPHIPFPQTTSSSFLLKGPLLPKLLFSPLFSTNCCRVDHLQGPCLLWTFYYSPFGILYKFFYFILLLYPSSPNSGIVSASLIFPFTYMCKQYLHHIHPPTPFPHILPKSPRQDMSCSPVLFCTKKKRGRERQRFLFV
jgi:hypothetical protein